MPTLGWIVVTLALIEGGWLAFDGCHALITGDYVTPKSGPYAGQLGPWSKLVSGIGLDPRGTPVMLCHVVLGAAWLIAIACFACGVKGSWVAMLACAIAGLWYLPFGTLLSVLQIVMLLLPTLRNG